jgi:hypothetical protein
MPTFSDHVNAWAKRFKDPKKAVRSTMNYVFQERLLRLDREQRLVRLKNTEEIGSLPVTPAQITALKKMGTRRPIERFLDEASRGVVWVVLDASRSAIKEIVMCVIFNEYRSDDYEVGLQVVPWGSLIWKNGDYDFVLHDLSKIPKDAFQEIKWEEYTAALNQNME